MAHRSKNLFGICIAVLVVLISSGCGEYPGSYKSETLTFESPITAKKVKSQNDDELNLEADASKEFFYRWLGGSPIPSWGLPLLEYYRHPLAVEIPISPFHSLVDYVHPFYFAYLDGYYR